MPTWSIKIVPNPSPAADQPAAFVPDLPDKNAGDPLEALGRDLVTWNNTTNEVHQPWPTDANYTPLSDAAVGPRGTSKYLSDPIPANGSSRPSWRVTSIIEDDKTIYYSCKNHPLEHGTIQITN
jgi:hypothetical protein